MNTRVWALWCALCLAVPTVMAQPSGTLPVPKGAVVLTVHGNIGLRNTPDAAALDLATLKALPQHHITTNTPWYDGPQTFSGPRLRDVLTLLKPQGSTLHLTALNDYAVHIPLSDLEQFQPILAWQINGQSLSVRNKGPLFLMYPFDTTPTLKNDLYYSRAIWQVVAIIVK